MAELRGAWTENELETFLDESRIPIRLSVHRGDGSLWMVALWYRYRNGSFECATPANTALVEFLRGGSSVAFDVSTNDPPYRGVRGNGGAALSPDEDEETLRALIDRYLGEFDSPLAEWLLTDESGVIRIRIQPNELYTWDYSGRVREDGTPSA